MDPKEDRRAERARRRRRVVILLVFVALIAALIFLFRAVLMPFLVALFIAYLIDPVVERLAPIRTIRKFKLGRAGSIIVLYLVFLFTLYLGAKFAIPAMGGQLRQARNDLPELRAAIEEQIEKFSASWENFVGADEKKEKAGEDSDEPEENAPEPAEGDEAPVPPEEPTGIATIFLHGGGMIRGRVVARSESEVVVELGGEMRVLERSRIERIEARSERNTDTSFDLRELAPQSLDRLVSSLDQVLGLAIKFVGLLVGTLYKMVLIMMITAFIVIDKDKILAFFRHVPPGPYRKTFAKLGGYIDRGLAGVIRGQLMICGVNGLLTWIGLAFLGVRYAGLLGIIAGVFSLVPIFGTIFSSIPIVLIAWGAGSFHKGVLALGWILVIHFVEANFLNPKIMGSASKIHPVVVVFALLAGEHAYGIVGALLAVPTVSIIQSSFKFYVLDRQAEAEAEADAPAVYP